MAVVTALTICIGAGAVLRVNGPIYDQIVLSKDLVGDILPPPEYVIEAFLESKLAQDDPGKLTVHAERIKQLHQDYDDRRTYWSQSNLPASLKDLLLKRSDAEAALFWDALEHRFLPALRAGDEARVRASYIEVRDAYDRHRAAIDELVKAANAFSAEQERWAQILSALAAVAVLGACVGIVFYLRRGFRSFQTEAIAPVAQMTTVFSRLAGGDLTVAAPFADRTDEVGQMAKAVEAFRAAALEARQAELESQQFRTDQAQNARLIAEEQKAVVEGLACRLHAMAEGDLNIEIDEFFPEEYKRLRMDFNQAVRELNLAMHGIMESSAAVADSAQQMAFGAESLAKSSNTQAATLEETAAAHTQITATVSRTLSVTREAAKLTAVAQMKAESSRGVMEEAVASIGEIRSSSEQINQIIGVIDEIAFQTNLLALNAGVEAARAGDAGRGFAVVAQEVRALAQRSADAAKEIKDLIQQSGEAVSKGVRLVNATGATLNEIVDQVSGIAHQVADIAACTEEQARSLEEVNGAISNLDSATQMNASVADEAAHASLSLTDQAMRLNELVRKFTINAAKAGAEESRAHAA